LRAVLEMRFDGLVNLELKIIVEQIRSLNKSIAELEETIAKEGQNLQGHANLTSIKGIGGLSGSILLSIIGDIHDFPEEGNLAAYSGSFREFPTPTKPNTAAGLPNAGRSWVEPL
jgi:transposase